MDCLRELHFKKKISFTLQTPLHLAAPLLKLYSIIFGYTPLYQSSWAQVVISIALFLLYAGLVQVKDTGSEELS